MERSITVSMMIIQKFFKSSVTYLLLFSLLIFKNNIMNLCANLPNIFLKENNYAKSEVSLLKNKISFLEEELKNLTKLDLYTEYNYQLTRMSYRKSYNEYQFFIFGGRNQSIHKNSAVINELGLVGIVKYVRDDYSLVEALPIIHNLSININGAYGTITKYDSEYLIAENFSNYDDIQLNDTVYTSQLGTIKEKIKIGTVYKIENSAVSKKIYIKTPVNFQNINYLYVVG